MVITDTDWEKLCKVRWNAILWVITHLRIFYHILLLLAMLVSLAACGKEDVDFAVVKAREAFEDGRWSRLHPSARKLELDDAQIAKGFVLEARGLRMLAAMEGPMTNDNQLLAYKLQRLAKFRYGGALEAASAALVQRFAVFNGQPAPGGAQGAGSRP